MNSCISYNGSLGDQDLFIITARVSFIQGSV